MDPTWLGTLTLFSGLPEAALHDLAGAMTTVRLAAGQTLFEEGDAGDAMFVVAHGTLDVRVRVGSGWRSLARVGRGQPIGERALLTGEPRSASVVARRDSELLRLAAGDFDVLLAAQAGLAVPLFRILARRMTTTIAPEAPRSTAIALLPLHAGTDADALTRGLHDELARVAATRAVAAASFDEVHGDGASLTPADAARSSGLSAWLSQLDESHRFVLYQANRTADAWTRRCVRQADRVVLVADAAADPAPGTMEALLEELGVTRAGFELVLVHPAGADLPTGTAVWLDPRPGAVHHHIRRGHGGDLARVARALTGRATGLVLGGGGARGFAHLGLLRALQEERVNVDCVGGTSMGSGIAMGFAMEMDLADLSESLRDVFIRSGFRRAWAIPMAGLLSLGAAEVAMAAATRGRDVEDSWRRGFTVSTNLTRASVHLHDRGSAYLAVRASGSLPGVVPPALLAGDVLVDGGLLDNLPVRPMRQRVGGMVLAHDVGGLSSVAADPALPAVPSGLRLLWNRISPFETRLRVPTIPAVLMQSLHVACLEEQRWAREAADLTVRPPVDAYDLLAFDHFDAIVESGYRSAMAHMDDIRRVLGTE